MPFSRSGTSKDVVDSINSRGMTWRENYLQLKLQNKSMFPVGSYLSLRKINHIKHHLFYPRRCLSFEIIEKLVWFNQNRATQLNTGFTGNSFQKHSNSKTTSVDFKRTKKNVLISIIFLVIRNLTNLLLRGLKII